MKNTDRGDRIKELKKKHSHIQASFGAQWEDYFGERLADLAEQFSKFKQEEQSWESIFQPSFYSRCLLQKDINFYNYLVRKLNKDVNQYSQKLKSEKKQNTNTNK